MADGPIASAYVTLRADGSQLKSDVQAQVEAVGDPAQEAMTESMAKAQAAVDDASARMTGTLTETGERGATSFTGVGDHISGEMAKGADGVEEGAGRIAGDLEDVEDHAGRMGSAFNSGTSAIGNALGAISGLVGQFLQGPTAEVGQKVGDSFKEAESSASGLGDVFAELGKTVAIAGAAGFGVAALEGVHLANSYDAATTSLASDADITTAQAKKIGDAFLGTAGSTIYSAQTIMSAYAPVSAQLAQVEGHALTNAQAMTVMKASMDLAEASGSSLSSSTSALAVVMQTYHLSVGQASNASDVLFNVSRLTNTSVSSVASAVDRLKGRLGDAAPSLTDTGALLDELSQHGVDGNRGISMVSTALVTLMGSSSKTKSEVDDLGLHLYNAQGQFVGMRSVIEQLGPKLDTMTDQQRNAALQTLFGSSAAQVMGQVLQGGVASYDTASAAVGRLGSTHEAAEKQSGTFQHTLEELEATGEDLATRLGEVLIPIINDAGKAIAAATQFFEHHRAVAEALAGVIGGVLAAALGAFIAEAVGGFVTASVEMVASLGRMAAGFLGLQEAEETSAEVAEATGDGLGPLGMALGVVAMAAMELATHWTAVWDGIKAAFDAVWGALKTAFNDVVSFLTSGWGALIAVIGPVGWLIAIATHWSDIWNGIKAAFEAVASALTAAFDAFVGFVTGVWQDITQPIVQAWNVVFGPSGAIVTAWDAVRDALTSAFNAFIGFVTSVWHDITQPISDAWNVIFGPSGVIMTVWDAIKAAVQAEWSGWVNVVHGAWTDIIQPAIDAWNDIFGPSGILATVWGDIATAINTAWGGFVSVVQSAWAAITAPVTGAWDAIFGAKGAIATVWGDISSALVGDWQTFTTTVGTAWAAITGAITGAWDGLKSAATNMWDDVKTAFVTGIDDVIRTVNDVFVKPISDVFGTFGVHIGTIPLMAAAGGTVMSPGGVGSGFVTRGPTYLVGEGKRGYPEVVIPTDPAHHDNATALLGHAAGLIGYAGGGILGDLESAGSALVHGVTGVAGDVMKGIRSFTSAAVDPVLNSIRSSLDSVLGAIPPQFVGSAAKGTFDSIITSIENWVSGHQQTPAGGGGAANAAGLGGSIPSGSQASLIDQALAAAGVPVNAANASAVNIIVTHESGWNPNAINNYDINAQEGDPSRGLMQVIGTTFAAWRDPSLADNIYNPLANLVAGIRYAVGRYGSLLNVPGVVDVSQGRGYVGYEAGGLLGAALNLPVGVFDTGGYLPQGWSVSGNFTGAPEPVGAYTGGGVQVGLTVQIGPITAADPQAAAVAIQSAVAAELDGFVAEVEQLVTASRSAQ